MAVYLPMGHGLENPLPSRKKMPPGCSLTVIETCGAGHYWPTDGTELKERTEMIKFLKEHPDKKYVFRRPRANTRHLNKIFGSVAVYEENESYPNIHYDLMLSWPFRNFKKTNDVRYSGLITLDTFIDQDFTSRNIVDRLLTEKGEPVIPEESYPYLLNDYDKNDIWMHNCSEIFKHSLYPHPSEIARFGGGLEERRALIMEYRREYGTLQENEELYQGLLKKGIEAVDDKTKTFFRKKMLVSLETLMEQFPGHYIHLACRSTPSSFANYTDVKQAGEEIALKRVLYMTPKQIQHDMKHIQNSRRNRELSKFSARSTKSIDNMLMTGFRRSLMHNEFRSKTPRLRAIRENSENEDSFYRMRTLRNKPKKKTYTRSRKYKLKFKSSA
jgi:hypothetical protein